MYRILLNLIILLTNLCFLLPSAVVQTRETEHTPTEQECFDEEHPPPTIAGGLDVIVTDSTLNAANLHPERKAWGDDLTQDDFERRHSLPEEVAQIDPDIIAWTSCFWEGWWEVGCLVEPFDEKKVLVIVHYFGLRSATWFWRERSGRVVDEMADDLLPHEQGHFDLVELGRRRWQNRAEHAHQELIDLAAQRLLRLRLVDFSPKDKAAISKKAREMIDRLANQEELRNILRRLARFKLIDTGWAEGVTELYDRQTEYGSDRKAQELWENEIDKMFDWE